MRIARPFILLVGMVCCSAFGFVSGDWWRVSHAPAPVYLNTCIIARSP